LGLTFKENCPDLRNSRVIDIIRELEEYGISVQVHDPLANPAEAAHAYGIALIPRDKLKPAAAVISAVAHDAYRQWSTDEILALAAERPVLIDVKGMYDPSPFVAAGIRVWQL
jgi:UDP-N-acetyl-D-galactosamine dehydrogenase